MLADHPIQLAGDNLVHGFVGRNDIDEVLKLNAELKD
jgi:hypothetical protein